MDMSKNKKIALGAAAALVLATFLPLGGAMGFSVTMMGLLSEAGGEAPQLYLFPISAVAALYFVWSNNHKLAKISFAVPYILFVLSMIVNSDEMSMIGSDGISAIFEVASIAFYIYLVAPAVGIFFSKD